MQYYLSYTYDTSIGVDCVVSVVILDIMIENYTSIFCNGFQKAYTSYTSYTELGVSACQSS